MKSRREQKHLNTIIEDMGLAGRHAQEVHTKARTSFKIFNSRAEHKWVNINHAGQKCVCYILHPHMMGQLQRIQFQILTFARVNSVVKGSGCWKSMTSLLTIWVFSEWCEWMKNKLAMYRRSLLPEGGILYLVFTFTFIGSWCQFEKETQPFTFI